MSPSCELTSVPSRRPHSAPHDAPSGLVSGRACVSNRGQVGCNAVRLRTDASGRPACVKRLIPVASSSPPLASPVPTSSSNWREFLLLKNALSGVMAGRRGARALEQDGGNVSRPRGDTCGRPMNPESSSLCSSSVASPVPTSLLTRRDTPSLSGASARAGADRGGWPAREAIGGNVLRPSCDARGRPAYS